MPVYAYILMGIAFLLALILFILFSKAKVVISYDDRLKIYAKFYFIKINLSIPDIIHQSSIKTEKRRKKFHEKEQKKGNPLPRAIEETIAEIRILLDALIGLLHKIRFYFVRLRVDIGCDNAATTALVYAGVSQAIGYIIELLRSISNVDMSKHSDVSVNANFISQKSDVDAYIVLKVRVIDYLIFDFLSNRNPKIKKNTENT